MSRILSYDPKTKTIERFHYNHADDSFIIEEVQDVEDLIERNRASFVTHDENARHTEDFTHYASIPPNIWWELVRLGIANDEKALRKWLDDPMFGKFRMRPGLLSR